MQVLAVSGSLQWDRTIAIDQNEKRAAPINGAALFLCLHPGAVKPLEHNLSTSDQKSPSVAADGLVHAVCGERSPRSGGHARGSP